jgi:hypothetical protein
MTPPRSDVARRAPLLIAAAVVLLTALVVLLTPRVDDDDRLTITRPGADNAKLFAQLAARLGWPVRATATRFTTRPDTTAIHVVLDGPIDVSAAERARLLDAVRRGAGLLLVTSDEAKGSFLDSLGLAVTEAGTTLPARGLACSAAQNRRGLRDWPARRPTLITLATPADSAGRRATRLPRGARSFIDVETIELRRGPTILSSPTERRDTLAALVGLPYGRGRIVVAADGDVVRTDVLRVCEWGMAPAIVRALEYLSEGRRPPLLVAEAYQGEVEADGATRVVREALTDTRPGRATLALGAAGLLLLAARGRRTLAPLPLARETRRSPLEHVDALATAWARVRGTRTVARQLVAGVRRRHGGARHATSDDATFLRAIAARHPDVRDDAERLVAALAQPVAPGELPALRRAAARVDAACLLP